MQIFDENHVTLTVVYPGQTVKLGPEDVTYGEHVYLFMRTQPRSMDEKGLKELNERQDAVIIKAGSSKPYVSEVKYDPDSFNKLRNHLLTTGIKKAIIHKGFIEDLEDIVFPHYQMVNLGGWAGLPAKHAFYFVVVPGDESAKAGRPSSMTFTPPPVQYNKNGYWSLTLYNEQGWVKTEKIFINSHNAKPNPDGSYTLHFNTPGAINNLEVVENWNGLFRCYLPESVESILEYQAMIMENLPKVDIGVSVTKLNYARAMVDMAMQKEFVQGANNTNWNHHRNLIPLDKQPAPMMNRDTLYSFSVVDGGGDVAITLPKTDGRYQSLHIFDQNHVTVGVYHGPGRFVLSSDKTTNFFVANVRTQVDPKDPADIKKANEYQDKLRIEFLNNYKPKPFQVTEWNMEEFKRLHEHYVAIAQKEGVTGTMGTLDSPVSIEDRNRGVATATGLLPDNEAVYLTGKYQIAKGQVLKATYPVPDQTDAKKGFYSITMYGDDQYLHTEKGSILNNREITLNSDGASFDVYFVMKDDYGTHANELLVPTETFNITMRIYLPGKSVQDGEYTLPVPSPVETSK